LIGKPTSHDSSGAGLSWVFNRSLAVCGWPGVCGSDGNGWGVSWAPRITAGSTAGDPVARVKVGGRSAGCVQGRGGGIDTGGVTAALVADSVRGGGTCAFDFRGVRGSSPALAFVVVCCTGGVVDGGEAENCARQTNGSKQGSETVAKMIVNLPIRSIGRGSFPFPPDRNPERRDSGRTGRHLDYRLVRMGMLMTNLPILRSPF
jgi:hypothetical protein